MEVPETPIPLSLEPFYSGLPAYRAVFRKDVY